MLWGFQSVSFSTAFIPVWRVALRSLNCAAAWQSLFQKVVSTSTDTLAPWVQWARTIQSGLSTFRVFACASVLFSCVRYTTLVNNHHFWCSAVVVTRCFATRFNMIAQSSVVAYTTLDLDDHHVFKQCHNLLEPPVMPDWRSFPKLVNK